MCFYFYFFFNFTNILVLVTTRRENVFSLPIAVPNVDKICLLSSAKQYYFVIFRHSVMVGIPTPQCVIGTPDVCGPGTLLVVTERYHNAE